jgi:hypothetical protein
MLTLLAGVACAQQLPDHHKFYSVLGPDGLRPEMVPIPVTVVDQFGTWGPREVSQLWGFSPPVEKTTPEETVFEIKNQEDHLTWYDFTTNNIEERDLLVTNQFGDYQEWTIAGPRYLLLPAQKLMVDGNATDLPAPTGLDHYLCYDATAAPMMGLEGFMLQDQFMPEPQVVTVHQGVLFCNPADKILPNDNEPIYNEENHLACYIIDPSINLHRVITTDQFREFEFDLIFGNDLLCVPSSKCIPDKDEDGYIDINCGGDDCNDANANIYPGNANTNCDCADPTPQGTPENQTAGNCTDGEDNDCDGIIDTDPECTGGSCTGTAAASTLEGSQDQGPSGLSKHLAYFLVSVGALIGLIIWRRKR